MKDFGEILHEEFNKVEEYYVPDEKEHIIWDSEINLEDELDKEEIKANEYQDYLDTLEDGEEPQSLDEFCDDLIDRGFFDNYYDANLDDLKENILPEIDKQINENYLMLCGGYNSNYPDFKPSGSGGTDFEGVQGFRDYISNFDRVAITSTDGVLGAICGDHDGTVAGQFYTLPDDPKELIKALGLEEKVKEDYADQEIDWDNEDVGEYDSIGNYRHYDLEDLVEKEYNELITYGGLDVADFQQHLDLMKPIKDTISMYGQQTESKEIITESDDGPIYYNIMHGEDNKYTLLVKTSKRIKGKESDTDDTVLMKLIDALEEKELIDPDLAEDLEFGKLKIEWPSTATFLIDRGFTCYDLTNYKFEESKKLKTEGILRNIQQEDEIDEWKVFSADVDTSTEQGKNLVSTFKDYEDDVNNVITGIRIDYNTENKNYIVCYIDNNGGFHNIDYKLSSDELAKLTENKEVKTEDVKEYLRQRYKTPTTNYIAKCTLTAGDKKFKNEYLLLDTKDSNGMSGVDIILENNRFNILWYNCDYGVENLKIVAEVKTLDELIDFMKSVGVDLSGMVKDGEIEVGMSDRINQNLYRYVVDDEESDPKFFEESKKIKTEAEEKMYLDGELSNKFEKEVKLDFSNADMGILRLMYRRLDNLLMNVYDNSNADNLEENIKAILSKADVVVNNLPITNTLNEAFNLVNVVRSIVGSKLEEKFGYDFYYDNVYESKQIKTEIASRADKDMLEAMNKFIKKNKLDPNQYKAGTFRIRMKDIPPQEVAGIITEYNGMEYGFRYLAGQDMWTITLIQTGASVSGPYDYLTDAINDLPNIDKKIDEYVQTNGGVIDQMTDKFNYITKAIDDVYKAGSVPSLIKAVKNIKGLPENAVKDIVDRINNNLQGDFTVSDYEDVQDMVVSKLQKIKEFNESKKLNENSTEHQEAGVCPVCGNEELEYTGQDLGVHDSYCYSWVCPKCHSKGREWYEVSAVQELETSSVNSNKYEVEGICPDCGGPLDYDSFVPDGMGAYYEVHCPNCNFSGKEWYDLTFDEHEVYEENK